MLLACTLTFTFTTEVYAQNSSVTGKITDEKGEAIIGASVKVKGTGDGTITDLDGKFSIKTGLNSTLTISYVGYVTQDVALNGRNSISIQLKEDSKDLDELVVVGYGTVKKRDLTGSVSSIKADDIAKSTSSNAMQAMQAKVPGLDIQQSSGQAGAGLNITLRGNRSILANNSPLILVDGIDYGSTIDINPSDIESMEVLKDASSTAIYGSRGANGVIIITTKKGKAGKSQINFNSYLSSNIPTNVPQMMYGDKEVQRLIDKANYQADLAGVTANPATYFWGTSNKTVEQVLTESYADFTEIGIYNDKSYTDWLDMVMQNGLTQNYELSMTGGNDKTIFNMSLGAMTEEGLLKDDIMKRYNGRLSLEHTLNKYIKAGSSLMYTHKNHDARSSSVFSQSMKMTTITHPYTADGELIDQPNPRYAAHASPLFDEQEGAYVNNTETTRFFGNGFIEIRPIKSIIYKSMFALDQSNVRAGVYQDYKSISRYQSPTTSYISNSYSKSTTTTWDNTLNYNTSFGGGLHDLGIMLGSSLKQSVYEMSKIEGDAGQTHYYSSLFYDTKKITGISQTGTYIGSAMLSYFGRLNYKFNEKYLLTASVRADGASQLAETNKWGYFPSVSGAWRLKEEQFMSNLTWIDNLKVRASWGVAGSAAIDPYQTLANLSTQTLYYYLGGLDISSKVPSKLGNENLKWETTKSTNFGFDFAFLKNRISGTIDYYITNTDDLLYMRSAPASSVFPSLIDNIGKTKGNGIEVALNTEIIKGKLFNWNVNWSYSNSNDEIVELSDGLKRIVNGREAHIVGQPVKIFYNYESDGVWNVGEYEVYKTEWLARHPGETLGFSSAYGVPGTIKIVDKDDNGKFDDEDKRVYERSPKHLFGMNNSFTFGNLSLDVMLYARLGGYIEYDMNSQLNFETANWGNLDYWTPTNISARFPSPGSASSTWGSYGSALLYEKADYIKIKDITLGYNFPTSLIKKVGLSKVKVYGSLKNFFTFSNIDNYDPERGGSISFPLAKQMVVGLNIQL